MSDTHYGQTIEYYEAYDRRAKERDFPLVLVLM